MLTTDPAASTLQISYAGAGGGPGAGQEFAEDVAAAWAVVASKAG